MQGSVRLGDTFQALIIIIINGLILPLYFKRWWDKNVTCIPILMVPLDSLKNGFFKQFSGKYCPRFNLPLVIFLKVVNFQARWIALGRSNRIEFRHTSRQNISHPRVELLIALQYSIKKPYACAYFNLRWVSNFKNTSWIYSKDPATPQSNSSCLEMGHFGKTATGSIKLEEHFYQNYKKKLSFRKNPVVPSELECLSNFYWINVGSAGACMISFDLSRIISWFLCLYLVLLFTCTILSTFGVSIHFSFRLTFLCCVWF